MKNKRPHKNREIRGAGAVTSAIGHQPAGSHQLLGCESHDSHRDIGDDF